MWMGNGNNPVDANLDTTDWNRVFKEKLTDELTEEQATETLSKFLRTNIGFFASMMTGQILEPYQRIMIKGWMQKNFTLTIAGRSFGKSLVFSHFCYIYCLLNPGVKILLVSHTFRSSRQTVERIDMWARSKSGNLLRQTFDGEMKKRQDLVQINFKNGSQITAVPLGDPDNLRGFRCNVLGIDEGLLIPQHTINMVLKPFLAGSADATQKQLKRRKETRLIKAGKMKEEDREVFLSDSKMIILSSASYKWEELYDVYKGYRTIIEADNEAREKSKLKAEETTVGIASYLVHQMSYEIGNPALMDSAILEEIKKKLIPQATIDREYKARFIDESGGFFSAKQMADATVPMGQRPCIEITGEKGYRYVLGIDPAGGAIGADPAGDHFAMVVLKLMQRADGKWIGMVVHQYACAGVNLEHHISYLYYILKRFNIVYIVIDSTGGENMDFLNVCNQSQVFKERNVELNQIDAEFAKEGFDETVKAVKRSYNPDESLRRIVHNQYFSSSIIKAGNDHLRASFEQKTIQFASHAQSVEGAVAAMCGHDILNINTTHPEFRDPDLDGDSGSMWDFVTKQDGYIELVKKECALIEVTSTPLGHLCYDLPHHMTRNRKNVNRVRKDSYSALWLAAWGMKILLAADEAPMEESNDTFAPMLIG